MATPSITLFELGNRIKATIATQFDQAVWVMGEISELRMHRNGHCYLELIEKDPQSDQIVARMRATIWSYSLRLLKPYFETTTRQPLSAGIKVLVKAKVEFQEQFGLSLNVTDIDPTYTLGDMARRRMDIIARLHDEGVFDMNRETELPVVVQRIAVISSPTAAGYEDFLDQLRTNKAGIRFYVKLFPAIMQGERAQESIIEALGRVFEYEHLFDCVAIMRGGGSSADLICFDSYELALHVAQFPLPVLTGIGHDRDQSVTDMVAHTQLKTPTAVAEFIINHTTEFEEWLNGCADEVAELFAGHMQQRHDRLDKAAGRLVPMVKQHIERQNSRLARYSDKVLHQTQTFIAHKKNQIAQAAQKLLGKTQQRFGKQQTRLDFLQQQLQHDVAAMLKNQHRRLTHLNEKNDLHDPVRVLNRGYSITWHNGKVLKDSSAVQPGDDIVTRLKNGTIITQVKTSNE